VNDEAPAQAQDRPLDAEKLLRLTSLAGQVLEEVRQMDPADENTARELAALHRRVTSQLYDALPNSLVEELKAIDLQQPFADGPTGPEVRMAYAGLIGWLGGLLQGLRAAMQMAQVQQLQQGRQAVIPPGPTSTTGQYL
jgi:proteasome activator-like protein